MDLSSQISNPRYVYLQLERGILFRHRDDVNYEVRRGDPVRFSLLAGESMLVWARSIGYKSAVLLPVDCLFRNGH